MALLWDMLACADEWSGPGRMSRLRSARAAEGESFKAHSQPARSGASGVVPTGRGLPLNHFGIAVFLDRAQAKAPASSVKPLISRVLWPDRLLPSAFSG